MAGWQKFSPAPSSEKGPIVFAAWMEYALTFGLAFVFLFLTADRTIYLYDEGITLTAAIRVGAGQIPYRDFYFIYGPALPYALAALFKIFGSTVLVARMLDLVFKSLLCATFFVALHRFCRLSIAIVLSVVLLFWIFILQINVVSVTPTSLFSFLALLSLQPVFTRDISLRRYAATGGLIGLTALFRLDCGIAVLLTLVCSLAALPLLRPSSVPIRWRKLLFGYVALFAGAALVIAPLLIAYRAVAPWSDIRYDLIEYPARYYRVSRHLPLLHRDLGRLGELYFLLPGFTVLLAGAAFATLWRRDSATQSTTRNSPTESSTMGLLISFGLFAALMWVKGLVRIEFSQNYLALVPTFFVLAVLVNLALRSSFWVKAPIWLVAGIYLLCTVRYVLFHTHAGLEQKSLVLPYLLHPQTQAPFSPDSNWCSLQNPATSHVCYLVSPDHMHAIEFLDGRICPGETLYVGLKHHDRIFMNDNATYFLLDRLPATKWSHMDPHLQNRVDIQQQMISELEAKKPPYIVLTSEYEVFHEPNDSSVSSGVVLLDDFIRQRYKPVKQFGGLTILERNPLLLDDPALSNSGGRCNTNH
jgi:hypothetical protein